MTDSSEPSPSADSVSCAGCGVVADSLPVGWSRDSDERGVRHLCEACTRLNVRSIEGRLAADWW